MKASWLAWAGNWSNPSKLALQIAKKYLKPVKNSADGQKKLNGPEWLKNGPKMEVARMIVAAEFIRLHNQIARMVISSYHLAHSFLARFI